MLGEQGGKVVSEVHVIIIIIIISIYIALSKYSGDEEKKEQHFIDTSINITELELTKKAKKLPKQC